MPDLDDAVGGIDAQVAVDTDRVTALVVDNGEETGVVADAAGRHPVAQLPLGCERTVRQVSPVAMLPVLAEGVEQRGRVSRDIERLDSTKAPLHLRASRMLARTPALDRKPDRLIQLVVEIWHLNPTENCIVKASAI